MNTCAVVMTLCWSDLPLDGGEELLSCLYYNQINKYLFYVIKCYDALNYLVERTL